MPITDMPLGVTAVMLPDLDFDEQVVLCQKLGVTHYSLRPRVIPDGQRDQPYGSWGNHKFDLTPQRLVREAKQIRQRLIDAGLVPFGTLPAAMTCEPDEQLQLHLEGAAAVGAGRIRIAPDRYPQGSFDYRGLLGRVVQRYGELIELARPMGLKIVIETHAQSLASGPGLAWNICRDFDPADIGVIFDIPNFAREGNVQPYASASVLGPYIDHCHVGGSRRVTGNYDPLGFRQSDVEFCLLSESDLHIPTWIAAVRAAGAAVPLVVEDFTPNVPSSLRLEECVRLLRRAMAAG